MSEIDPRQLPFITLDVRGTVNRGRPDAVTFQQSNGGLQIKCGVQAGFNPKSQRQQLQRIQLLAATRRASQKEHAERNFFAFLAHEHGDTHAWSDRFKHLFIKFRSYGEARYGCGIFSGNLPDRLVRRYGSEKYGEGFYVEKNTGVIDLDAVQAEYPNIDLDCFQT